MSVFTCQIKRHERRKLRQKLKLEWFSSIKFFTFLEKLEGCCVLWTCFILVSACILTYTACPIAGELQQKQTRKKINLPFLFVLFLMSKRNVQISEVTSLVGLSVLLNGNFIITNPVSPLLIWIFRSEAKS